MMTPDEMREHVNLLFDVAAGRKEWITASGQRVMLTREQLIDLMKAAQS